MRRLLLTVICMTFVVLLLSGNVLSAVVSLPLQEKLNSGGDQTLKVFLWFDDQAPVSNLTASMDAKEATLAERHAAIINALKSKAETTQGEIIRMLEEGKTEGEVISYKSYWIANFIYVEAHKNFILQMAAKPEFSEIFEDFAVNLIEPIRNYDLSSSDDGPVTARVEDGLQVIGAPEMWDAGYTGQGRIVMNIDTGVDVTHPALSSRWVGNNGYPWNWGWLDTTNPNSQSPYDNDGHGTHTMGTMTGLGASTGDTVGVAFGAMWIAARAIVDGGNAATAFQWGADPDGDPNTMHDVPDVISNSWGASDLGCYETYWQIIDNVEAVGPVVVFSAGNDGPGRETCGSPGNRATSPTNAFAVGAINGHDANYPIASFSGRGPSLCDHTSIKPEVVAPGVNVRSSVPGGGYSSNYSGTSMSCPHVAGAIALLREYNPNATATAIKTALMNSAHDLGSNGEDNDYGWGLINVYDAMLALQGNNAPYIKQWSANYSDGDNNVPDAGETGDIIVTLWNTGTAVNGVWALLSSSDPFVQINNDSSYFGDFAMGDTLNNLNQQFNVTFDENTPRGRIVHFTARISGEGGYRGVTNIQFMVGTPADQAIAKHDIGNAQFTISNFGHYGLASGAMLYFPGGIGFKYPFNRSSNLFEAGLLIGTGPDQLVDCVRTDAQEVVPEFLPTNDISVQEPGAVSDQDMTTSFNDQGASNPLGFEIQQNSYMWSDTLYDDFVVVEYLISNFSGQSRNVVVAQFNDWDFPWGSASSDRVDFDRSHNLGYMFQNPSTAYRGVAVLSEEGVSSFRALDNTNEVYPPKMTKQDKWNYMNAGFTDTAITTPMDASFMIATGPITIAAGETKPVAFAYMGASSLEELGNFAAAAYEKYWTATSVDDGGQNNLPAVVGLSQNYPNPFNAETAIKFYLPKSADAKLEIYNLMGQKVAEPVNGKMEAGNHAVTWNAADYSSGIYFYKLTSGDNVITKRMTLLK